MTEASGLHDLQDSQGYRETPSQDTNQPERGHIHATARGSGLLPHGSQAGQQSPLPAEPSCQPMNFSPSFTTHLLCQFSCQALGKCGGPFPTTLMSDWLPQCPVTGNINKRRREEGQRSSPSRNSQGSLEISQQVFNARVLHSG